MGTYGKSRGEQNARFIRRVGLAVFLMGVVVFTLWFGYITGMW